MPALRRPRAPGGRDAGGQGGCAQCAVGGRDRGQPVSRDVAEAIARTRAVLARIAEQDTAREAAEAERLAALRARPPQPRQARYRPTGADVARVHMVLGMIDAAEARWIQGMKGGGA